LNDAINSIQVYNEVVEGGLKHLRRALTSRVSGLWVPLGMETTASTLDLGDTRDYGEWPGQIHRPMPKKRVTGRRIDPAVLIEVTG
jgi:hypothetical protein